MADSRHEQLKEQGNILFQAGKFTQYVSNHMSERATLMLLLLGDDQSNDQIPRGEFSVRSAAITHFIVDTKTNLRLVSIRPLNYLHSRRHINLTSAHPCSKPATMLNVYPRYHLSTIWRCFHLRIYPTYSWRSYPAVFPEHCVTPIAIHRAASLFMKITRTWWYFSRILRSVKGPTGGASGTP
jgi:hypothetical protein